MSRSRKPEPLITYRLSMAEALAMYEAQEPTRPGNILGEFPFVQFRVYANLAVHPPAPVSPEVRELFVGALAEALVSAYRRGQKNDLASRAALAFSGSKEELTT